MFLRLFFGILAALCAFGALWFLMPQAPQKNDMLILIIDSTSSFAESFESAKEELAKLVEVVPLKTLLGIVSLSDEPEIIFKGFLLSEEERTVALEKVKQLKVTEKGGSDVEGAFALANDIAMRFNPKGRKVILAFTDGITEGVEPDLVQVSLASLSFPPFANLILIGVEDYQSEFIQALVEKQTDVQMVDFADKEPAMGVIEDALTLQPKGFPEPLRYGLATIVGSGVFILLTLIGWPKSKVLSMGNLTITGDGVEEQTLLIPPGNSIEVGSNYLADCHIDGLNSSMRLYNEQGRLVAEPVDPASEITVRSVSGEETPIRMRTVLENNPATLVLDNKVTLTLSIS